MIHRLYEWTDGRTHTDTQRRTHRRAHTHTHEDAHTHSHARTQPTTPTQTHTQTQTENYMFQREIKRNKEPVRQVSNILQYRENTWNTIFVLLVECMHSVYGEKKVLKYLYFTLKVISELVVKRLTLQYQIIPHK